MPVYEVLDMPYEEFLGWFKYFELRPVGWRSDNRTAMLLSAQGVKKKPHELFNSLAAIKRGASATASSKNIDPNFMRLLRKAKQGDDWNPTINGEKENEA